MATDISPEKLQDGFSGYFKSNIDRIRNNFVNNENFDEFDSVATSQLRTLSL